MVDSIYIRRYSLIVSIPEERIKETVPSFFESIYGKPPTGGEILPFNVITPQEPTEEYFDYRIVSKNPIEIKDLQLQATILYEKDVKSSVPQQATITLYNLSEDTQEKIKEEQTVQLSAGYVQDDELPILFIGQIAKKTVEKRGVDTLTTLYCSDSYTVKKTFRYSEQFPTSNTYRQNLEKIFEIAALNGVPRGNTLPTDPNLERKSLKGWLIDGQFYEQINKLCDSIRYRSYTALGKLYIEPVEISTIVTETIKITENNIKGSLRSLANSSTNFSTEKDKLKGIGFSTFLDGRIVPEKRITIEGTDFEGTYTISSLKHILDFEGNKWDTVVECKRQPIGGTT
jgi:hypothetical protein